MEEFDPKNMENEYKEVEQEKFGEEKTEKKNVTFNTNYNTNYNKSRNGCLIAAIIGLIVAIIGAVFIGLVSFGVIIALFSTPENEVVDYPYVGVIDISGTIVETYDGYPAEGTYSHTFTLNCIDEFTNDDYNKGIILYINSPGGGIYESDELYDKLMSYKEITGRPVFAYMAQTAASGGLYAAMAADEIFANRMTTTGSIGVVMSITDLTGLYEKLGIETIDIVSGENKTMNEMNDEQKAILQAMIDEYYGYFVDIVAESRGLDREYVKSISDGRTYTASQAKALGLIDTVATYDEFMENIFARPEFQNCEICSYEFADDRLMSGLFNLLGVESDADDVSAVLKSVGSPNQLSISYK